MRTIRIHSSFQREQYSNSIVFTTHPKFGSLFKIKPSLWRIVQLPTGIFNSLEDYYEMTITKVQYESIKKYLDRIRKDRIEIK